MNVSIIIGVEWNG